MTEENGHVIELSKEQIDYMLTHPAYPSSELTEAIEKRMSSS